MLLLAALALSVYHFGVSSWNAGRYGYADFPIFLHNARVFLANGTLYPFADDLERYSPAAPVYKFPPLYALFLLPVVHGGIPAQALNAHWALQLILYALAVALLLRLLYRPGRPLFLALGLVAALNFEPFFETLWRLQIETPLLLLLALLLYGLRSERPVLAGTAWGLGAMLKVYPVFLAPYLALRRRGWTLLWAAFTGLLVLAATLIVFGPEQNRVFYLEILPHLLRETPTVSPENTSWGRLLQIGPGLDALAAKRLVQLAGLAMTVLSLWVVQRSRSRSPVTAAVPWALELSLFVALMLFCMPNAWANYQLLLLLPVLALIDAGLGRGRVRPRLLTVVGAAYALMLFYAPCGDPSHAWPCAQTPAFLGLSPLPRAFHDRMVDLRGAAQFLLWGACLRELQRRQPSP